MKTIDPAEFDSAFRMVVARKGPTLAEAWHANPSYTRLLMDDVLPGVARALGLICHPREDYSLDRIFVEEDDYDLEFGTESGYPIAFSVIVEHENDVGQSCEEMSKLLLFNAPLKVLISYAYSPEKRQQFLDRYGRMVERAGHAEVASRDQRLLVVLGEKPGGVPVWRSYVFAASGFRRIAGPDEEEDLPMKISLVSLEKQARALPEADRARLADALLQSLHVEDTDAEADRAWADELRMRAESIERGDSGLVDSRQVFGDAENRRR